MSTSRTPILSSDLANDRISRTYPYLEILEPSDALAIVLPELDSGELPVLCTLNGSTRRLASIRKSAIVIKDLLAMTALNFYRDENTSVELKTIEDIMEVLT